MTGRTGLDRPRASFRTTGLCPASAPHPSPLTGRSGSEATFHPRGVPRDRQPTSSTSSSCTRFALCFVAGGQHLAPRSRPPGRRAAPGSIAAIRRPGFNAPGKVANGSHSDGSRTEDQGSLHGGRGVGGLRYYGLRINAGAQGLDCRSVLVSWFRWFVPAIGLHQGFFLEEISPRGK